MLALIPRICSFKYIYPVTVFLFKEPNAFYLAKAVLAIFNIEE